MIATVSTVKDRLDNVKRFVEGNLDGGVDHMVIFLDAPEAEVEAYLSERREVTAIVTDDAWWSAARPQLLNRRQNINANLTRTVLGDLGGVDWLFHIDADEVLQLDREQLAGIPKRRRAVGIDPMEVVSVPTPDSDPVLFKRLLNDGELHLVTALGLLDGPENSRYFRSHIAGKVGVRPKTKVWLGIHKATNAEGQRLLLARRPGLELLHFEGYSREEFVRKWATMVSSGPQMNFGSHRLGLATALRALVELDLDDETKAKYLSTLYVRHMADPVEDLDSLGLLERRPLGAHGHVPQLLSPEQHSALRAALESHRGHDMMCFVPPKSPRDAKGAPLPATATGLAGLKARLRRRSSSTA